MTNIVRPVLAITLGITLLLIYLSSVGLWSVSFFVVSEGLWAPWDIASARPPAGHWQSKLNWFFEAGPGVYLPAVLFLVLQLIFYGVTLLRSGRFYLRTATFALSNIILFVFLLLIGWLIPEINPPAQFTPDDWQYYGDYIRELPYTIIILAVTISTFVVPPFVVSRAKTFGLNVR